MIVPNPNEGQNPDLKRLNQFVGEWKLEVPLEGQTIRGGRETFEWLEDGSFLRSPFGGR